MKSYTFWQLLEEYKIVIPCYQRDFAQGRLDKDSSYIRKSFVKDLCTSIKCNKELNLNLVFGSEKDKEFVPVDGQQRLTTLFLVYWYVAIKANELQKKRSIFKKFTYKTRQTSTDFFNMLTEINNEQFNDNNLLSSQIQDHKYFFKKYMYDPTVKSSLCMLDEIENGFGKECNWENYWEYLTSEKCSLIINLILMADYKLSDTLYLKMNGRGKPLSDFENFKAWMIGYVRESKWDIKTLEWEKKLDTLWLDVFWTQKDDSDFLIDQEYMRFFNGMIQLLIAEKSIVNNAEQQKLVSEFVSPNNGEELRIPLSRYEELECFSEVSLNLFFDVLGKLSENKIGQIVECLSDIDFFIKGKTGEKINIFRKFISENITYQDRLRFYGLFKYLLIDNGNNFDKTSFNKWMRVVRNIVEDTNNDAVSFIRMVGYLNDLSEEGIQDVYACLDKWKVKSANMPDTIKHEINKATFLLLYPDFEQTILIAENHPLFRGKVGFLLSMIKDEPKTSIVKFERYVSISYNLFNSKGSVRSEESYTLMRALFASGWEPKERTYLINDSLNWRNVLLKNHEVRKYLEVIFHNLYSVENDNHIETLEKYCDTSHSSRIVFDNLIHYKYLLNSLNTDYARLNVDNLFLYTSKQSWLRIDPTPTLLFNKVVKVLTPLGFNKREPMNYLPGREDINEEIRLVSNNWLVLIKKFEGYNFFVGINLGNLNVNIEFGFHKLIVGDKITPNNLTDEVLNGLSQNDWYWGFEKLELKNENIEEFVEKIGLRVDVLLKKVTSI